MQYDDDIITQLQNKVDLLSSAFFNYAGFLQHEAPPLGPTLRGDEPNEQKEAQKFIEEKREQCVRETVQTANTIYQVRINRK